MFENLYEDSVQYDDHLLQAACCLQAEFDLSDLREYAILKHTSEFKHSLDQVSEEYRVSKKDLRVRLQEILRDNL